jgi:hypothetical protein
MFEFLVVFKLILLVMPAFLAFNVPSTLYIAKTQLGYISYDIEL